MKLTQTRTKTISAATEDDLDAAFLAFVQEQGEATFIDVQFMAEAGFFALNILYTK